MLSETKWSRSISTAAVIMISYAVKMLRQAQHDVPFGLFSKIIQMTYSTDWLLGQLEQDHRVKYLFFWGNQPSKDGRVTKACLSQWWPADFTVAGVTYRSTEQWMMAEKARLFNDSSVEDKILAAKSPAEAKKLGREIRGFMPDLWEAHKYEIVKSGNLHKFGQHKALAAFLLTTGDRVLVEASPVDTIWGIGLAADAADAEHPSRWRGPNLLGFALMEVRDQLQTK